MKQRMRAACLTVALAFGTAAPALSGPAPAPADDPRDVATAQVEFGIQVAQKKLWSEATYRFEKAVEIDPTYAAAWNNLAIAYEQQGKFPDADRAYAKAVELNPDNVLIRQNYDLFKEIYDRIARRNSR